MRRSIFFCVWAVLLTVCSTAHATTFTFNTDPFAGSTALTTPGRQVVGGEEFIPFSIGSDVFSLGSILFWRQFHQFRKHCGIGYSCKWREHHRAADV